MRDSPEQSDPDLLQKMLDVVEAERAKLEARLAANATERHRLLQRLGRPEALPVAAIPVRRKKHTTVVDRIVATIGAAPDRTWDASALVAVLPDVPINTIRMNLTRLAAADEIRKIGRGRFRAK